MTLIWCENDQNVDARSRSLEALAPFVPRLLRRRDSLQFRNGQSCVRRERYSRGHLASFGSEIGRRPQPRSGFLTIRKLTSRPHKDNLLKNNTKVYPYHTVHTSCAWPGLGGDVTTWEFYSTHAFASDSESNRLIAFLATKLVAASLFVLCVCPRFCLQLVRVQC